MAGVDQQFELLAKEFSEQSSALVEKVGPVPGAPSMFNPFHVFRYSKFGLNPNDYRSKLHFDNMGAGGPEDTAALMGLNTDPFSLDASTAQGLKNGSIDPAAVSNLANDANNAGANIQQNSSIGPLKPFADVRRFIENPTASNIIEWSRTESTPGARTAKGPTPYSTMDFLYCKYYGKVPNNRLVTLRRYPIPVEDNLAISALKTPLVPIAQAVTWYGNDIGNDINNILNLNWGFKWKNLPADVQDIQGNELTVEDLVAALPFEVDETVVQVLKTQIFGVTEGGNQKIDLLKLSGYDVEAQKYIKEAFNDNGPYWNRVLGPVNVIDSMYMRDRGFNDNKDSNAITLKFNYSLRSFRGLNPKMVFLDLMTNFLSLTYNTAPFWGGGARYFQQTGVTLPALRMEQQFFEGDMLGALHTGAEELSQLATSRLNELIQLATDAVAGGGITVDQDGNLQTSDAAKRFINTGKQNIDDATLNAQRGGNELTPVDRALAPRLGRLLRRPLIYRTILDGRAVGEWHVTVGNPMNPIGMIGNLCLDTVNVKFSNTLGIDDFPTEVEFTVKLKHGRPRAKQDIESIFNLGNGAMSFSPLPPPSSASNSFGEENTARQNAAFEGNSLDPNSLGESGTLAAGEIGGGANAQALTSINQNPINTANVNAVQNLNLSGNVEGGGRSMEEITNMANAFRGRVGAMYGEGFANSPILIDYFTQLKTKD